MKKNIFKAAALTLAGAFGLFSCSPSDPVKPTEGKPTVTIDYSDADYGVVQSENFNTVVSTSGDTAFITINVNGTQETDAIYIKYQKDNDKADAWKNHPNATSIKSVSGTGTNSSGQSKTEKFDLATNLNSFTYDVPNNINKKWSVTIPVLLRSGASAMSDVFTICITKPGSGRFDNPAKNLAYGVATVTLNYTNEKLVNFYETTLGNASDTIGSLFSTSTGSNYQRSDAANSVTGPSVDFVFNTTATSPFIFGSFYTSTNTVDAAVQNPGLGCGFGDVSAITNFTKVAKTTADFDNIIGETSLTAAVDAVISSTTTTNKVVYTSAPSNEVFAFVTKAGKKGLVKINSAAGSCGVAGQSTIQVKVQR